MEILYFKVRCNVLFAKGDYAKAKENNLLGLSHKAVDQFPQLKAVLMLCHALVLERNGEIGASIALLEEVYEWATIHKLQAEKGVSLYSRGQLLADLGNTGDALKLMDEANTIFRKINDEENLSNVLNAMANILYYEGNHAKAVEYYLEVLALTSDDAFQESLIFYNLGNCYLALEKTTKAQQYFENSQAKSQEIDDVPGVAYAKFGVAKVAFAEENYDSSLAYLEQAQTLFESLDMQNQAAQVKAFKAHNYLAKQRYATAEELYQEALAHYQAAKIKPGIQSSYRSLANVYSKLNQFEKAYQYSTKYIEMFTEQVNNNKGQALAKMQVIFDTEKKEFENKFLTRELKLQTDINEQARQQGRLKTALLVLSVIAITLMGFLIRKHIRHKEMFRRLSQTDELTQLNNRRQIINLSEDSFELCKRYQTPATLLVFDIDHFKQFNDRYGHDVGDRVLVRVAETAQIAMRKTDHVGRFGGEEFLVLLTNTSQAGAADIAERLRQAVAAIADSDDAIKSPITISIGGAEMKAAFNTLDEVIKQADNALYAAKQAGRNCVIFAEDLN